jgi:hypothetical protein
MSVSKIITEMKNFLEGVENDIDSVLQPGIAYLEANVPAEAITIGEGILAAAANGTPWATLLASMLKQAEAAGITLVEAAASAALNAAQTNLIAKGDTASVLTPTPQPVASTGPAA